jgi:hypothetical protein
VRGALLVALFLAGALPALAACEVYLNHLPFKGRVSGSPQDLWVEAPVFFAALKADFSCQGARATLNGVPLEVIRRQGVVWVRARQVAELLGGRYTFNEDLGSVDIYALTPVQAARAGLGRVLARDRIDDDRDFCVLAWLAGDLLSREAGLKLTGPLEMSLAEEAELTRAGLAGTTGGVAPEGRGVRLLAKRGSTPFTVLTTLASGWATAWCRARGCPPREGFGLWTGFYLLRALGVAVDADSYGSWTGPEAQGEFQELLRLESGGGPAAVLQRMRSP